MKLVIAEKPSVAMNIAEVLGAAKRRDGYMEGNGYLVSWCVGHLIELAEPESYGEHWKKWTYESLPIIPEEWQHEIKEDTREQYEILEGLMYEPEVDTVVCATDAGREGELIFRLVYEMACCKKPVERLWISSMEESAIREGFENLRPGNEYENLYHAARCRQEADWLVGINGTRLFTVLYGGKTLRVGRVQTPTLAMLVEREQKIRDFKKEKYYKAHILCDGVDAVTGRIDNRTEAERITGACLNGQALVTSVVKEEKSVSPPKLYDLTTLQRDANRLFGFTAKQTLEYTQSLYEKKLCTYPRTDSQYLSGDMQMTAENVVTAIFDVFAFVPKVMFQPDIKRVLNSKKVTDHHAIIPTLEIIFADLNTLPKTERKILALIAARFLCATGEKNLYEAVRAELVCAGNVFSVSGKAVLNNGWKIFEESFHSYFKAVEEKEEQGLPELYEGMVLEKVDVKVSEHVTSPPKHFTEDSLLSAMERAGNENTDADAERKGLGTPATRADIIEKLIKGGFAKREEKNLIPTEHGINMISVLPEIVTSPKLTADWENALTLVAKGEVSREDFMAGIMEMVKEMVKLCPKTGEAGKALFAREKTVFGKCPACGGQVLAGKYGAYCESKCGMNFHGFKVQGKEYAIWVNLKKEELVSILEGKKTLVYNIPRKDKEPYDAYLTPSGIMEYTYVKDGKEYSGKQYEVKVEYPKGGVKKYGRKKS